MEKTVLFVLLDDFADWEGAFLAAALRGGVQPGRPGKYAVKYAAPAGRPVRSIGGMRVVPDCDTTALPDECGGLILIGGMSWQTPDAEAVAVLVREALSRGIWSLRANACCDSKPILPMPSKHRMHSTNKDFTRHK